jgi:hypothetical protein
MRQRSISVSLTVAMKAPDLSWPEYLFQWVRGVHDHGAVLAHTVGLRLFGVLIALTVGGYK